MAAERVESACYDRDAKATCKGSFKALILCPIGHIILLHCLSWLHDICRQFYRLQYTISSLCIHLSPQADIRTPSRHEVI